MEELKEGKEATGEVPEVCPIELCFFFVLMMLITRSLPTVHRTFQPFLPYTHPAILDIKLGTVLYDEDAAPEKKARMIEKAKQGTTWEMGMRMTGFQVSRF